MALGVNVCTIAKPASFKGGVTVESTPPRSAYLPYWALASFVMDGTALWKATRAFTISDIDGSDSNNCAWLFVAYGVSAFSLDAEDLTVIIEGNTG